MTTRTNRQIIEVFALIALFVIGMSISVTTAQGPQLQQSAGGCVAGNAYDPACDVNRDGSTDILDLGLVATHWGQNGTWSSTEDFWALAGNAGTDPNTEFLGTTDDRRLEVRVNNERALRIEPATDPSLGSRPNLVGGHADNSVTAGVVGATISGGGAIDDGEGNLVPNRVTDHFGTIGGGGRNRAGDQDTDLTSAYFATVGGGSGNTASGAFATVGGGASNSASGKESTVGGGGVNLVTGDFSTIGGGFSNKAFADYATVAGGGPSQPTVWETGNRVTDDYGAVGGGGNNQAGNAIGSRADAAYATVSGGKGNTASGPYATIAGGQSNAATNENATISGGTGNTASGLHSTVSGGANNTANNVQATVGGGFNNTASGQSATVPGGANNTAQGNFSFAAGQRAKANHNGTFVWADSTGEDFASTATNQFLIRASAGVGIGTTNPGGSLHINTETGAPPSGLSSDNNGLLLGVESLSGYKWIQAYGGPLVLNSQGNDVGIGTPNPDEKLVVDGGNSTTRIAIDSASPTANAGIRLRQDGISRWSLATVGADGDFQIFEDDASANRFIIKGAGPDQGNVGIGIDNPTATLDVRGTLIRFRNTSGASRVLISTTGNGAAGAVEATGPNGNPNVQLINITENPDHGAVAVFDAAGNPKAQMQVGPNGDGLVLADVKNFRVPNPNQPGTDIIYASIEGPEAAAYVRGTTRLVKGEAIIMLPDHFVSVASPGTMTVQLTPLSANSLGLAVVEKSLNGIVVKELHGGAGTYDFDWEVKAVRKGYENYRVIRPRGELDIQLIAER